MRITTRQAIVLFDLAKEAMKQPGGFGGYSNETIKLLLNNLIANQDNSSNIIVEDSVSDDYYEMNDSETDKKSKSTSDPSIVNVDPDEVIKSKPIMIREDFSNISEIKQVEKTKTSNENDDDDDDDDDDFW